MNMRLEVFIDVFGRVSPKELFTIDKVGEDVDYFNELLKELFVNEYCYGDLYKDYQTGSYIAEFEFISDIDYSYNGVTDNQYLQIKTIYRGMI